MTSGREIEPSVDAMSRQLVAAQQALAQSRIETSERLRGRVLDVGSMLQEIWETVKFIPPAKRVDAAIGDCLFSRLEPLRHQPGVIRPVRLNDGAAVVFTTELFLCDGFQTLVLPADGERRLITRYFNCDAQVGGPLAEGSQEFIGAAEIAASENATRAIAQCAGGLAVEARFGWQDAITSAKELGIDAPPLQELDD